MGRRRRRLMPTGGVQGLGGGGCRRVCGKVLGEGEGWLQMGGWQGPRWGQEGCRQVGSSALPADLKDLTGRRRHRPMQTGGVQAGGQGT